MPLTTLRVAISVNYTTNVDNLQYVDTRSVTMVSGLSLHESLSTHWVWRSESIVISRRSCLYNIMAARFHRLADTPCLKRWTIQGLLITVKDSHWSTQHKAAIHMKCTGTMVRNIHLGIRISPSGSSGQIWFSGGNICRVHRSIWSGRMNEQRTINPAMTPWVKQYTACNMSLQVISFSWSSATGFRYRYFLHRKGKYWIRFS